MKHILFVAGLLGLLSINVAAQSTGIRNLNGANLDLMNNHDPEAEKQNFDLLPGYEINLFAAEPMLANPIHMAWDSRGRLWVACSWAYPQLEPGDEADDKIIILEDTDHDGVADKSTVFTEGLYMPTGIELANGGCYVAQTPDVFFLKDTDGDDVADVKELALTGFGIEDSHHSMSAWRRGPGGWLYFQEGIFLTTQVETQYGVVRNYDGGVYQYNPRSQELRMFARIGVGNPWGHVFDKWGQSFFVDNPRVSYLSPSTGNSGRKVELKKLIQTEKQCGGDLVSGVHLPEELQGQLLTCRFKSRAVIRYEFIENGAGFQANVLKPLVSSRHPNFRPVDCKIGPDGAVYVADWYNSIINHAKHDFRDPRRDHSHGRVWRITAKGRPLAERPKLVGESIASVVEQLKSPNTWTRHQARLVLSEREPNKVREALEAWADKLDASEPDHDLWLVEAMWACQNVGQASPKILEKVLSAKDGHARSAGARVIRYWHTDLEDPIAAVAKAAGDTFPRTRMEAILSAGFVPNPKALTAALVSLDHPRDAFIDVALPQTLAALEPLWRPAVAAGDLPFASPEHRAFVEREAGIGFDKRFHGFLRKKRYEAAELDAMRDQFASRASGKHAGALLGALTSQKSTKSDTFKREMLVALEAAVQRDKGMMGKRALNLRLLLDHKDDAVASAAARILGASGTPEAGPRLWEVFEDKQRTNAVRESAAIALAQLGRADLLKKLESQAKEAGLDDRLLAIRGLVEKDIEKASGYLASALALPGSADVVPVVRTICQRKKGARALSDACAKAGIHADSAGQLLRYHRESGQLPASLVRLLSPSAPSSLSKQLLREEHDALTQDVDALGNAERGEMIYRRKAIACTSCHAIGPVGPSIGPNLVAVGAGASTEYVVETILEPNKSIAQHYENVRITTKDKVYVGSIHYRSDREVVIHDSSQGGGEVRIPAGSITSTKAMSSLMPAELVDQLKSRQEFLDLAKFVSQLGLPGPYANNERPFIRDWEIYKHARPRVGESAGGRIVSKVNGDVPLAELGDHPVVLAGEIDVLVAGPVGFRAKNQAGFWVDGKQLDDPAKGLKLGAGRHRIQLAVNPGSGGDVSVELIPLKGSGAKVQPAKLQEH